MIGSEAYSIAMNAAQLKLNSRHRSSMKNGGHLAMSAVRPNRSSFS